ncbi:MAG: hypothetical protein HY565_01530 [Candidatus Kerfeldbacteria bacterium]|nr:hypothetical protein [Candidatus Kerfeldbacteria bacterium]
MGDFQGKDLSLAYWYNTHRAEVRTFCYGLGIAAVSLIWLINIIMVVQLLLKRGATNRAIETIADTSVVYDSIRAPSSLIVTTVDAISHTADTVDAYAIVSNPNQYYVGRFSYTMTVNGTPYSYQDGIIMPASDSYIVVSDLAGVATSSAHLTIDEVTWQRIHGPQPEATFVMSDLLINTTEVQGTTVTTSDSDSTTTDEFATPDEEATTITTPGEVLTQVSGSVTNASAYGFRRVKVTAVVKNTAGVVLGVQQHVLTNVDSFSAYDLLFSWRRRFEFNAQASFIVETDTWDTGNLIKPGDD